MKCLLHPDIVLEDCPRCNALEWRAEAIAAIEGPAIDFGISPALNYDVIEAMRSSVCEAFRSVSGLVVDLRGGGWPGNSDDLESVCRCEARAAKNPASLQRAYFKAYAPETWADAVFSQLIKELCPRHAGNWWEAQQAAMTPKAWRLQCAEGMKAPKTWGYGFRLRLPAPKYSGQHDVQARLCRLHTYLYNESRAEALEKAHAKINGIDNAEGLPAKDWPPMTKERAAKAWGWRVECTGAGTWVYIEGPEFQNVFIGKLLDLWEKEYARALRVK